MSDSVPYWLRERGQRGRFLTQKEKKKREKRGEKKGDEGMPEQTGLPKLPANLFGDHRDDMPEAVLGDDGDGDDQEVFPRPKLAYQRWDEKELDRVFEDEDDEPMDEAEYEQWYLLSQRPDPVIVRNTLIRRLRENDAIWDTLLEKYKANHPGEYAAVYKHAKYGFSQKEGPVLNVLPPPAPGQQPELGDRPRRERPREEEEEGRRPVTPQGPAKQAPIVTPPSADQDESSTRRNRQRMSPPSEDDFIDAACTYLVDEICGDNLDLSKLVGPAATHIGALATDVREKGDKSDFGRFFDRAVARAVKDLFGKEEKEFPAASISCAVCGKETDEMLRCSACKQVHYCGAECQRSDWKISHKFDCIAGKDDDDDNKKKEPTMLVRRPPTSRGLTSRGSQHAQIVLDKDLASRSRERLRVADEAKRSPSVASTRERGEDNQTRQKESARARERIYQSANIYLHFTDQAVVSFNGLRYGSEQVTQDVVGGEYPVTQLTSLITHAGEFTFRDGRYRFLQSKDGMAYRRKYPSERGKTSNAPWEQYAAEARKWVPLTTLYPESAAGWEVYIK